MSKTGNRGSKQEEFLVDDDSFSMQYTDEESGHQLLETRSILCIKHVSKKWQV